MGDRLENLEAGAPWIPGALCLNFIGKIYGAIVVSFSIYSVYTVHYHLILAKYLLLSSIYTGRNSSPESVILGPTSLLSVGAGTLTPASLPDTQAASSYNLIL